MEWMSVSPPPAYAAENASGPATSSGLSVAWCVPCASTCTVDAVIPPSFKTFWTVPNVIR